MVQNHVEVIVPATARASAISASIPANTGVAALVPSNSTHSLFTMTRSEHTHTHTHTQTADEQTHTQSDVQQDGGSSGAMGKARRTEIAAR